MFIYWVSTADLGQARCLRPRGFFPRVYSCSPLPLTLAYGAGGSVYWLALLELLFLGEPKVADSKIKLTGLASISWRIARPEGRGPRRAPLERECRSRAAKVARGRVASRRIL